MIRDRFPFRTPYGIAHEIAGGLRLAADPKSFLRLAVDVLLYRLLKVVDLPGRDRERRIRLRDGTVLVYRLNRGDIQSIREVWIDEAYRLPFSIRPTVVVDLGANIGLTSLWLARRYGASTVLAVEPESSNARIARMNLAENHLAGEVVQAAVGPTDGRAFFRASRDSNIGQVAAEGVEVAMVSMTSLLARLPAEAVVDLVKLDIEGGEGELMKGDLGWLQRVRALIAEIHLNVVDYDWFLGRLRGAGFKHIPLGSQYPASMDGFVRVEESPH